MTAYDVSSYTLQAYACPVHGESRTAEGQANNDNYSGQHVDCVSKRKFCKNRCEGIKVRRWPSSCLNTFESATLHPLSRGGHRLAQDLTTSNPSGSRAKFLLLLLCCRHRFPVEALSWICGVTWKELRVRQWKLVYREIPYMGRRWLAVDSVEVLVEGRDSEECGQLRPTNRVLSCVSSNITVAGRVESSTSRSRCTSRGLSWPGRWWLAPGRADTCSSVGLLLLGCQPTSKKGNHLGPAPASSGPS